MIGWLGTCGQEMEHADKRVMRIIFNWASSNAWYVLVDTMRGVTCLQPDKFGRVRLDSLTDQRESVGTEDGGDFSDNDIGG